MKITKARLKQIIQEELQALALDEGDEEKSDIKKNLVTGPSDEEVTAKFRKKRKAAQNKGGKVARQAIPKVVRPLYDVPKPENEQDMDDGGENWLNKYAYGDFGAEIETQGDASWEGEKEPSDTAPAPAPAAKPAAAPAGEKKARVARKGKGATRREINAKWKAGEFGPYEGGKKGTKSHAKWVKLRRTLANKGESAARAALGGASAPEQQRDVAKNRDAAEKRQNKAALDGEGNYADYLEKAQAASKTAKAKLGPPTGNIETDFLNLREKGLKVSETSEGTQQAYQELVNTYLDQGEEPRDARLKARKELISRLSKLVTKRSDQRRLAKQYFDRFKEQGLDNSEAVQLANAALSGTENPRSAPALKRSRGVTQALAGGGTGRPGGVKESVEKLTNLIAEEFKATLSEDKFKTNPKTEKIVRLLADQAPMHSREIAALIMQVSPRTPEKAAERVNKFLKSNNKDDKRFDKIIVALKDQAKNAQGSGDFAKKKQKFLKAVGGRSMGKPFGGQ